MPCTPVAVHGATEHHVLSSKRDLGARFCEAASIGTGVRQSIDGHGSGPASTSSPSPVPGSSPASQLRFPSPVLLAVIGPPGSSLLGFILSSHADPQEPQEALVLDGSTGRCLWSRSVTQSVSQSFDQDGWGLPGPLTSNSFLLLPSYQRGGW